MPKKPDEAIHVKPFICETLTTKALYFSFADTQSRMRLREPDRLDLEYTRMMMGFLLFDSRPARLAMIGLGGGSLAKFCHRHLPATTIDVIEINPHVIALRDEFEVPPDGPRFRVVEADGARFVRESEQRFDVLLVDGFDIHGLPAALSSQRFYDDCLDVLQPGGMLVANLHTGHRQYASQVERISNSVVFARKPGSRIADGPLRPAAMALRRPGGIEKGAWAEIERELARVNDALRAQAQTS